MKHKTGIAVLVIVVLLAAPAYAKPKQQQTPQQTQAPTIDDIMAKLEVAMDLTDQQAARVKAVIEEYSAREEQLKLDEKEALGKVVTQNQLYAWEDLQKQPTQQNKRKQTGCQDAGKQ